MWPRGSRIQQRRDPEANFLISEGFLTSTAPSKETQEANCSNTWQMNTLRYKALKSSSLQADKNLGTVSQAGSQDAKWVTPAHSQGPTNSKLGSKPWRFLSGAAVFVSPPPHHLCMSCSVNLERFQNHEKSKNEKE